MLGVRLGLVLGVVGSAAILLGLLLFLAPMRLRFALTWKGQGDHLLGEADVVLALGIARRTFRFHLAPPEPLLALLSSGLESSVSSSPGRTSDPDFPLEQRAPQAPGGGENRPKAEGNSAEGAVRTGKGRSGAAERVRAVLRGRRECPAAYARFRRALRHGRIEDLSVWLAIGTGDAATTAYLAGLLWGVLGVLLGWASSFVPFLRRPTLSVHPAFSQAGFSGRAEGIVRIPPVHAIRAALYFYQMYRKGRDGG